MKGFAIDSRAAEDLRPAAIAAVGEVLETGVIIVDASLVVRGWNRWMEAVTGRDAASAIGRTLAELFPGFSGSTAQNLFARALDGESVVLAHRFHEYLLELPCPVGLDAFERMQQSARIIPTTLDDGERGAVAFIKDVTERVAREAELRAAKEAAEAASRAKSEFLAAISHELRTPLTAVIGYSDLLHAEIAGALTAMQKDQVARVKLAAWHLIGIIDEILTFSRVDADREPVHTERLELGHLAREAATLLQPQARDKGIELVLQLPTEPIYLHSDAGKLRQILVNLIGNAVKFTDAGGVSLELTVEDGAPVFRVCDTGPGMEEQDLDRIFEPFTQLRQSSTRTKGGTGLGLPLSRKLTELLGGRLTVSSEIGTGTTFTLQLPAILVSA